MSYQLADLVRLMACLRDQSMAVLGIEVRLIAALFHLLLEEAYEVSDVIERGEFDEYAQLGDLYSRWCSMRVSQKRMAALAG